MTGLLPVIHNKPLITELLIGNNMLQNEPADISISMQLIVRA